MIRKPDFITTVGALALACVSNLALAADVTFWDFMSSDGGNFVEPAGGNAVGVSLSLLDNSDPFIASASTGVDETGASDAAFDQISFKITAAPNEVITSVSFIEAGDIFITGSGFVFVTGAMTVNSETVSLGSTQLFRTQAIDTTFTLDSDGQGTPITIDLATPLNEVEVTITNSLVASAFGPNSSASIEKTLATVGVETTVVPLPPAAWMMGSALLGLAAIRRKRG